ncbi:MAG TPA: undecaprenyl-diphosphatase UppP [Kofleriaceae bacterium]|nr:undecaprenyl-diphosphatase UppP [Kofleriaceae bacterium]
MSSWFAALLGLLQGITEFLPISSTAHLRIAPALLGQPDPGAAFTAVIQIGTLLAVIVYFSRDLFYEMPRAIFRAPRSPAGKMPLYIAVGTLPIVILGIALEPLITGPARSLYVVAAALAGFGVVMLVVDRGRDHGRGLESLTLRDAFLIGLAQSLALIPGVSRSGATIACALAVGLRRPDAARFSFLLSIPAIAGAGVYELPDAIHAFGGDPWPLLIGIAAAAVSGYAAVAWLIKFLGNHSLASFVAYRVALGAVLVMLLAGGIIHAV